MATLHSTKSNPGHIETSDLLITAFDHISDCIIITGPDGTILDVNQAFVDQTGFSREEAIGSRPVLVKSGVYSEDFYKNLWDTIKSGKPFTGIEVNRKKDGTLFNVEHSISPVFDETGAITHFIGSWKDVTEKVKAREALRIQATKTEALQQKLETLLISANDAIITIREDQTIDLFNQGATALFGYTPEEIIGKPLLTLIPERHRVRHEQHVSRFLSLSEKAGSVQKAGPLPCLKKDGTEFPGEFTLSKHSSGNETFATAIIRDSSERLEMIQEMESKTRHQQVLLLLAQEFQTAVTVDEIMASALRETRALLQYNSLWVYKIVPGSSKANAIILTGTVSGIFRDDLKIKGDPMMEEIALGTHPVIIENAESDPRTDKKMVRKLGNRTIINIPVISYDGSVWTLGTGTFGEEGIRPPTPGQIEFLKLLANQLMASITRIETAAERKKAVDALSARERRFRALIENSAEGIALFDPEAGENGLMTYISPASHSILGYFPEEVTGKSPVEFIHPEDLSGLTKKLAQVLENPGEIKTFQYRFRHKKGFWCWLESTVTNLVHDETIHALIFNYRDITQKKEASLLLERQLKFTRALNSIADVIATGKDHQNRILEEMARLAGETMETDRCLIFKIDYFSGQATSIAKWHRANYEEKNPGQESFPVGLFSEAERAIRLRKVQYIDSHVQKVNPLFKKDGSDHLIHTVMGIKSLLWFPFEISSDGFFLLAFNQMTAIHHWKQDEFEFVTALASEVSIAIENIHLHGHLLKTLNELEILVEGIPDSVFFKDATGRWLVTNKSAQKLFRIENKPWYGKTDQELAALIPETAEAHTACIELDEMAWGKGTRIDELEVLKFTDADPIYLETTKIPIFENGNRLGLVIIARNVTFEKKAQETITEQAMLLDNATDAIIVTDLNRNVLYWNHSFETLYGLNPGEIPGYDFITLTGNRTDDQYSGYAQVLTKGEHAGEFSHLTRTRSEIQVEIRKSLIRNQDGSPRSILHIITNITERKKTEQQYLRAQRMESIGRMASGIAHDLNNILSPILIAVQSFKEKLRDDTSVKMIGMMESNVERASDLMKRLLMFTRGTESRRDQIRIHLLLAELENILRSTFPKNISVFMTVPSDLPPLRGDLTQLHQVMLNLCVNARDAMPLGGELRIETEFLRFHDDYIHKNQEAQPGNYILIRVKDTGTGIPREVIEKIFDPFFTTKELEKGTGLGLSTVMAIVKSHGGFITVESEPGKGSEFRLYFPVFDTADDSRQETEPAETYLGNGEQILVVDDESAITLILGNALQSHNYSVFTASEGPEAISMFARNPDLRVVITDINMPVMDGRTLIKTLQAIRPDVKIIAMSGHSENELHLAKDGVSVARLLTKPFRVEKVLEILKEVLKS